MSTHLFGWVPPPDRNTEQHEAHEQAIASMPKFAIPGYSEEKGRFALWKIAKALNGDKHIPYAWQVTGSCFPAGTPVRMADGSEKPVEDVGVGDEVVTHTGATRQVVDTMKRDYHGEMVTVHVAGFPFPLTMTADHPVAVMRTDANWRWQPDYLEWVRADDLTEEDHVVIGWNGEENKPQTSIDLAELLGEQCMKLDDLMEDKVAPVRVRAATRQCTQSGVDWRGRVKLIRSRYENALRRHIPICPSFGRLIGLYLAEGGCEEHKVTFTFAASEESLAQEVLALVRGLFGVEGETFISNERETARKVVFRNQSLSAVFKSLIPGNVYEKRIPGVLMHADEDTKLAVLLGWLAGDGYVAVHKGDKPSVRIQGVTASPGLARDMTTLALSCGIRVSCSQRKARGRSRIAYDVYLSGKKAVCLQPQMVEFRETRQRFSDTDNNRVTNGYCRKIKRIEKEKVEALPVYDFEVEEDHSFIAGGLAVHNCVGAGGGNMLRVRARVEIAQGDPEEWRELWWPYTYGRSRARAGMRGRGEGSLGSAWAQAIVKDGIFSIDEAEGLPTFKNVEDWLQLTSSQEYEWSDGNAKVDKYGPYGLKHPVKTVSQIHSAEEAKAAIQNGYPLTIASMFGTSGPRRRGNPEIMLADWNDRWPHQMSVSEAWDHPTEGLVFFVQNNWGPRAHGTQTQGEPPGGFYIKASDMNRICKDEAFAFSGFEGFLKRTLDWYI